MLMDLHPSQQHAGLHHAVWRPQQEVTRLNARFKPTSPEKSGSYHLFFLGDRFSEEAESKELDKIAHRLGFISKEVKITHAEIDKNVSKKNDSDNDNNLVNEERNVRTMLDNDSEDFDVERNAPAMPLMLQNDAQSTVQNDVQNVAQNDALNVVQNDAQTVVQNNAQNVVQSEAQNAFQKIVQNDAQNVVQDYAQNVVHNVVENDAQNVVQNDATNVVLNDAQNVVQNDPVYDIRNVVANDAAMKLLLDLNNERKLANLEELRNGGMEAADAKLIGGKFDDNQQLENSMKEVSRDGHVDRGCRECDQIGQFIGLWATFQSLWQQLICPKDPTFLGNFVKVSKS